VREEVRPSMVWTACRWARARALWARAGEGLMERAVLRAVWRRLLGWGMVGRLCSLLLLLFGEVLDLDLEEVRALALALFFWFVVVLAFGGGDDDDGCGDADWDEKRTCLGATPVLDVEVDVDLVPKMDGMKAAGRHCDNF